MGQGIKEYFLVMAAPELGRSSRFGQRKGEDVCTMSQNQSLTQFLDEYMIPQLDLWAWVRGEKLGMDLRALHMPPKCSVMSPL